MAVRKLRKEIDDLKEQLNSTRKALDIALDKIDALEKDLNQKISNITNRVQEDYRKSQEERNTIIDEWLNGKKGE